MKKNLRDISLLPMKARIGDLKDLENPNFIFEPKLDGYRALCFVNKKLKFITRNNKNITESYPELDFRNLIKAKNCILDGEIVALDKKGRPSFNLLQRGYPAKYFVFDILSKDGKLLTNKSLIERKEILEQTVQDAPRGTRPLQNSPTIEKTFFTSNGKALWQEMVKRGFEGVMAKKADSLYYPGERSDIWLKIKKFNTIDCIIIGYTTNKRIISSLLLGLYDEKNNLRYIGKVGTGFTEEFLTDLLNKLKKLEVPSSAIFNKHLKHMRFTNAHWVKPKLVAEIKYVEFTSDKILRTPVFVRLRTDKNPKEATFREQTK